MLHFNRKKPACRFPVKKVALHIYSDDERSTSVCLYRDEIAGVQMSGGSFQLLLKHNGYIIVFQARKNHSADKLFEQIGDCMSETRPNVTSYGIGVHGLCIIKE